jgi:phospholipid/cholesterol/gamma-HCH transport system permease protein
VVSSETIRLCTSSLRHVLALQSAPVLLELGALSITSALVTMSMVKEPGRLISALMDSGRNAFGMASELGSMQITDQIDAMRSLGTDRIRKLVTPRVHAALIMLLFVTILSNVLGIACGSRLAMSAPARCS